MTVSAPLLLSGPAGGLRGRFPGARTDRPSGGTLGGEGRLSRDRGAAYVAGLAAKVRWDMECRQTEPEAEDTRGSHGQSALRPAATQRCDARGPWLCPAAAWQSRAVVWREAARREAFAW